MPLWPSWGSQMAPRAQGPARGRITHRFLHLLCQVSKLSGVGVLIGIQEIFISDPKVTVKNLVLLHLWVWVIRETGSGQGGEVREVGVDEPVGVGPERGSEGLDWRGRFGEGEQLNCGSLDWR